MFMHSRFISFRLRTCESLNSTLRRLLHWLRMWDIGTCVPCFINP
jgi:hypothetical protein